MCNNNKITKCTVFQWQKNYKECEIPNDIRRPFCHSYLRAPAVSSVVYAAAGLTNLCDNPNRSSIYCLRSRAD